MDIDYQGSSLSQETFVPSCFISVGIFWILAQNFFSKVIIYLRKDPPLSNLDLQPASTTELVMHLQSACNAPVMRLQMNLEFTRGEQTADISLFGQLLLSFGVTSKVCNSYFGPLLFFLTIENIRVMHFCSIRFSN